MAWDWLETAELQGPGRLGRRQDDTGRAAEGPLAASGTRIDDPGFGVQIRDQAMAVAVDHETRAGVAGPQAGVSPPCRGLMAVDQGQGPARQG